jgi:two-component system response regulator YesN
VFEYMLKPVKPAQFKDLLGRMQASAARTAKPLENLIEKSEEGKEERQFFIEESLHYIKEHFTEKLTLDMVASKVFVNPKYYSHVFRKEMGVTFTDYVVQLRVQHACKLLEMTNYRSYRISLECGFSDPSYFNRVFCAQMNMTPQTYRKYIHSSQQDATSRSD